MEARSIELALEEGLEPVRNRDGDARASDLHLEIVVRHTYTNADIRTHAHTSVSISD